MVDTEDLKSSGRNTVPVRVRSPAPQEIFTEKEVRQTLCGMEKQHGRYFYVSIFYVLVILALRCECVSN